ncbi:pyridoxal phosphate-dependent aminotransferase [Deltaproteobacteria bacterium]|nr:pyridoxal phosphate-dependent aminotransferase [Deltaproteobacteria bacterium]
MKYSSLVERIAGKSTNVWDIHNEARKKFENGEDVILLSIGEESDKTTPTYIQKEAIASIQRGRHHYTQVVGENHFRKAIAKRHQKRTGQQISLDNVCIFVGAQNALFSVCLCLLEQGNEVIVPELYYATYPATVTAGGATMVAIPTNTKMGFQPDPQSIAKAVTPKTRALLLNSPNNPSGAVYSQGTLTAILELCRAHNIWVISDEVYSEIAPEGFTPIASLPGSHEQTVTISSLSKSHRMTGWRCGWMVGPEKLTRHLTNLNMCMTYGLPPFIQDAAVTALEKDRDTAKKVKTRLDCNKMILRDELELSEGAKLFAQGGGMFAILDTRPLGLSSMEFCWKLLDQQGVSVLPCDGFGLSGRGLIRISLCESEDTTREAVRRIRSFVKSL